MQHRNDDMLVYIAIGDAVAAATESVKPWNQSHLIESVLRLDDYYQHPRHRDLKPGNYTDDTQMSLAVAETLNAWGPLMQMGGHIMCSKDFAESWVHCFHRDPRAGYARGFQAFLESHKTPEDFLRDIHSNSEKNGACMRAVPIGVLPNVPLVLHTAKVQAQTTHNTPIGIFSAQAVALMSHFALYQDESFQQLGPFLEKHLGDQLDTLKIGLHHAWNGPVKNPATNTVHAVFHLVTEPKGTNLSHVLRQAIQFGGDTDSVAAIALGIASCRMPNDLPQVLFDKLENGPYGRDYLKRLGKQLMDTYA